MNREPTLKKAIEPYLEGIETDINYDPSGAGISALFLAVLYSTNQGSFSTTEEDRQYARKVVEILLDYGADPTRHEANNPKYATPLSLAKTMSEAQRDPEGVYELLLKNSINSATEGAAFENKVTSGLKNLVKKALGGVGNLGKKGLDTAIKTVGNVVSERANKILEKRDQEAIDKAKADVGVDVESTKEKKRASSNKSLSEEFSKLPDRSKKRFIYEKLPILVSNDELNHKAKLKAVELLEGYQTPYSSDLYAAINKLLRTMGGPSPDSKVWDILFNPKYEGMISKLKNTGGLESDPKHLSEQLAFIAYYVSNGKDLSSLKDGSSWKTSRKMKSGYKSAGKTSDSLTGREIILGALKKKGSTVSRDDANTFISKALFSGDTKKSKALIESNGEAIGKLLNKKFTKSFDDDNLVVKFTEELKGLVDSANSVESDDSVSTGRDIIIKSIGKKGPNLSKEDGIDFIAKALFKGDNDKADKFFEANRKSITQALNKKYEKAFGEDDLSQIFIDELKEIQSGASKGSKSAKETLTKDQQEASLALQGFGYSKKEANSLVKDKEGNSAQIVLAALKGVDLKNKVKTGQGGK